MTTPNYSIMYSAQLVGATLVNVGDVLIPYAVDETKYVVATSANRGTRGSEGIALTACGANVVGSVQMQQDGTIDATISGLGVGASRQLVRVSTTGRLERIASYTTGDDIAGYAEIDGRVHLWFGLPWTDLSAAAGLGFPIVVPGTSGHMIVYASDGLSGQDGGAPPTPGETNTMSNVGAGTGLPYKQKTGVNFELRSLLQGAGILVTNNTSDITIDHQRVQLTNVTAGTQNDVTTLKSGVEAMVLEFTAAGTVTVTGLANGAEGRAVFLFAPPQDGESGTKLVLNNQNAGSSAANRICTPGQQDYVVSTSAAGGGSGVWVVYDTTASRWHVAGADPSLLGRAGVDTTIIGGTVNMNTDAGHGLSVLSADGFYFQATFNFLGSNAASHIWSPNARTNDWRSYANVQTTDATPTNIFTFTPADEAVTFLELRLVAVDSTGGKTAAFKRRVRIKRDGGTVTVGSVESTFTDQEAALSATAITVDNSGATVRVRVTGVAATVIDWSVCADHMEVTHA